MTLTITVKEAKAALVEMKKLTPANLRLDDDAKISFKEAVFLMAPELVAMNKRGFTLKELADGLQAQNIPVKPATLNRYLNEYKAGQGESETVTKRPRSKRKKHEPGEESGTAQESAEASEANEAENKTEAISQAEIAGSPSETEEEKSQTPRSDYWNPFVKRQEQNPLRAAGEEPERIPNLKAGKIGIR